MPRATSLLRLQVFVFVCAQVLAAPVEVKRQHLHRGAERRRIYPVAVLGGALQRSGDLGRVVALKDPAFQIHGIAILRHLGRPILGHWRDNSPPLYGQVGTAPRRSKIKMMSRIVRVRDGSPSPTAIQNHSGTIQSFLFAASATLLVASLTACFASPASFSPFPFAR